MVMIVSDDTKPTTKQIKDEHNNKGREGSRNNRRNRRTDWTRASRDQVLFGLGVFRMSSLTTTTTFKGPLLLVLPAGIPLIFSLYCSYNHLQTCFSLTSNAS
jgi:hypothetical protein